MTTPPAIDSPTPPRGERPLAYWLLARNPYAAALVRRAIGSDPLQDVLIDYADTYWPGELADIITDLDEHTAAWAAYENAHPRPSPFGSDEAAFDRAYDAWADAGPQAPESLAGVTGMSGGELRALRCLAALGGPVRWEAHDLRSLVDATPDATLVGDLLAAYVTHP